MSQNVHWFSYKCFEKKRMFMRHSENVNRPTWYYEDSQFMMIHTITIIYTQKECKHEPQYHHIAVYSTRNLFNIWHQVYNMCEFMHWSKSNSFDISLPLSSPFAFPFSFIFLFSNRRCFPENGGLRQIDMNHYRWRMSSSSRQNFF